MALLGTWSRCIRELLGENKGDMTGLTTNWLLTKQANVCIRRRFRWQPASRFGKELVCGEGDQRREEVEEQSRVETGRKARIASVSSELMRKITSRRGGAARAPREVARRQLSSQTATGRSPSEVAARPSDLTTRVPLFQINLVSSC